MRKNSTRITAVLTAMVGLLLSVGAQAGWFEITNYTGTIGQSAVHVV